MKRVGEITLFIIAGLVLAGTNLWASPYDALVDELAASLRDRAATVAVAELESDAGGRTGRFIAAEISEAFVRAGVRVVDRTNIERISEELEFQLSGAVQNDSVAEIGQALGADYLVFGTVRGITRPGYSNKGLKVNAQLVDVARGRVVSSGSTEVEASDMTSPYRRREVRASAEYPDFLDLKLAGTLYRSYFYDSGELSFEEGNGPGGELGIAFQREGDGFFSGGWEFLYGYDSQSESDINLYSHSFTLGRLFLIRLPLWRYFEGFPFLTHAYTGVAASAGLSYYYGDVDDYFGIGFKAAVLAGWSQGLNDNLNLFAEYRYTPKALTGGLYGFGSDSSDFIHAYRTSGHQLFLGLKLMP